MVYHFVSAAVDPPAAIYIGKDKFESTVHDIPLKHMSTPNRSSR